MKFILLILIDNHAWKFLPQIRPRKCPQFPVSLLENFARSREFRILGTMAQGVGRKMISVLSANNRIQCTSSFVSIYNVACSLTYSSFCFSPPKRRHFKGQQKELQDLTPLTNFNRNLLRFFMEEKWNDRNIEHRYLPFAGATSTSAIPWFYDGKFVSRSHILSGKTMACFSRCVLGLIDESKKRRSFR